MDSFLQQMPALLGVLLGALATYGATAVGERSRWRREQLARHEERRLAAYSGYALTVKQEMSVILRLAAARGLPGVLETVEEQEGARLVAEAESDRTAVWESVLLVGSEAAVLAGREWHGAVGVMFRVASGLAEADQWPEAIRRTSSARRQFYTVVRAEVGHQPSADPAIFEWQVEKLLDGTFGRPGT